MCLRLVVCLCSYFDNLHILIAHVHAFLSLSNYGKVVYEDVNADTVRGLQLRSRAFESPSWNLRDIVGGTCGAAAKADASKAATKPRATQEFQRTCMFICIV